MLEVGDKVEIKSFEKLKELCDGVDHNGDLDFVYAIFAREMFDFCGTIATVKQVHPHTVKLEGDEKILSIYDFTEDMLDVIWKKTGEKTEEEKTNTPQYILINQHTKLVKITPSQYELVDFLKSHGYLTDVDIVDTDKITDLT